MGNRQSKKLTAVVVEYAKAGGKRRYVPDGGSGLYLVVHPTGAKSWACWYRSAGKQHKLTLGRYPDLSLAMARATAAKALDDVTRGKNPAGAKREARAQSADALPIEDAWRPIRESTKREAGRLLGLKQYPGKIGGRLPVKTLPDVEVGKVCLGDACAASQMASPAAKWGLPNWLDAEDYGDTKSWGETRWRWEFTRRREDYRADFDAGAERTETLFSLTFRKGLTRNKPGFQIKATVEQLDKYGTNLFNPRIADQPRLFFQPPMAKTGPVSSEFISLSDAATHVPDGVAVMRFDLDRPIAPQLADTLGYLSSLQMQRHSKILQSRRHPRIWLRYLRVLDGRECGATWNEIFNAVIGAEKGANFHPIQEAKRTWDGARHLMFNWPN
jgi:hypothetical protein